MTSTEIIERAEIDYKMLKAKGKEGEEILHYHGFLDGAAYGFVEAEEYYIEKACKWVCKDCDRCVADADKIARCPRLEMFRKTMMED